MTEKYSAKSSASIGKEYCNLLSTIEDKKSITMEFILFLLYLGSEKIVLKLAKNENIQRILNEKKFILSLSLPKISCIIINYQITSLKVSDTVYDELFHKYIKGKRLNLKK